MNNSGLVKLVMGLSSINWKGLMVVMLLLAGADAAMAQPRERPMPKTLKDNLWYGGSFGLGLAGSQGFTQFNLGIFPMVGYKIIPWFSVGPRLGFDYNYYKGTSVLGKPASTNVFSFYGGAFMRAKIYWGVFAQGEYGVDLGKFPEVDQFGRLNVDVNNKVIKRQVTRESGLVGLGYNSGGKFASEILLLYNLLEPDDSQFSPWNYRLGFTYNF
ncbi:MAG: hypothetical protein KA479_13355 [Saprospiraceae bacterium]|nr:hypothetical protein [Saprospiraceae bacterium]